MATILTDPYTFDGLVLGAIHGQDGWVDSGTNKYIVQNTVVYQGTKAVSSADTAGYVASKSGTSRADGKITLKMGTSNANGGVSFQVMEGSTVVIFLRFNSGGNIQHYTSSWQTVGSWIINTGHQIEMEWRSPDHTIKFKVDGGSWSAQLGGFYGNSWTTGLDKVGLQNYGYASGYWDIITENPYEETKIGPFPTHFRI